MFIARRKVCIAVYLLLGFLAIPSPVQAANSAASSLMSQAMLSMMDAMGNLAQQYNRNRGWSSGAYSQPFSNWQGMQYAPWSLYGMPGGAMPGQQQLQGLMNQAPAAASSAQQTLQGMAQQVPDMTDGKQTPQIQPGGTPSGVTPFGQQTFPSAASNLDGIWRGRGGEIVLVMYGHFRIYADSDHYRDGLFQIDGNWLTLYDPQSGSQRSYEYALNEGRMVLRDENGQLLLYRQLPIPVPPYTTFTGQGYPSVQQQPAPNQE
jgi:hypothetical protein